MNLNRLLLIWLCIILFCTATNGQTIQDYVEEHTDVAQELMKEHELPASVILAVAIHESAAGKSKVARHLNNHFGIKGPNSNTEINSSYRDYESVSDSYENFVEVLQSKQAFSKLFENIDQYDYTAWARGIQRGGYAASRTWAKQVIAIIDKYELYQYDDRPADYTEQVKEVESPVLSYKKSASGKKRNKGSYKIYKVKRGDNLNKIARSHRTTTKALMTKNSLKTTKLKPGQKIRI